MPRYYWTKKDVDDVAYLLNAIDITIPQDFRTVNAKKTWIRNFLEIHNINPQNKSVQAIIDAITDYVIDITAEEAHQEDTQPQTQTEPEPEQEHDETQQRHHEAAMSELRQRVKFNQFVSELRQRARLRQINPELKHAYMTRAREREAREEFKTKHSSVLSEFREAFKPINDGEEYQRIKQLRTVNRESVYEKSKERITNFNEQTNYQIDLSDLDLLNAQQIQEIQTLIRNWLQNQIFPLIHEPPTHYILIKLETSKGRSEFKRWLLTNQTFTNMIQATNNTNFLLSVYEQDDFKSDQAEKDFPDWELIRLIQVIPFSEKRRAELAEEYKKREGSFLPMVPTNNLPEPILKELAKCQIFQKINANRNKLKVCCWVYAFMMAGADKDTILTMSNRICDRNINSNDAIKVAEECGYKVSVRNIDRTLTKAHESTLIKNKRPNTSNLKEITINLFRKHYFLDFRTNITKSYLDNMRKINFNPNYHDCRYRDDRKRWERVNKDKEPSKFLTSGALLENLIEKGYLRDMTAEELLMVPLIEHPKIEDFQRLDYSKEFCISDSSKKKKRKAKDPMDISLVFFADTEADTSGEYHAPFILIIYDSEGRLVGRFRGEDCIKQGLEALPNNAVVYFHNLQYDSKFFINYGATGELIGKGHKDYLITLNYNNKTITLKDSLALIPKKLADFPKMFNLAAGDKECFPYTYYTLQRLESNVGIISEAKQHIHQNAENFIDNINKIPDCRLGKNLFDMYLYAEFYCEQDVRILQQGFMKFRSMVNKLFGIDVLNVLTAPALAHTIFYNSVYINPRIKALGGLPAMFIRKCIHGGRVMTRLNKAWHTTKRLHDFDAKSLYPSAMARLRIPLGIPKVLPKEKCNWESLQELSQQKNFGAYFVKCVFQPVQKHRDFPLFVFEAKDGNNSWDDNFTEPITVFCSHIMLEDIMKYYELGSESVEIQCGYYYDEGVDTKIQGEIRKIYDARRQYQKEKNELQEVMKLVMNSAYGKTIQKFITTTKRFMKAADAEKFMMRHRNEYPVDEFLNIDGIHCVITPKEINNQFTYCPVGALILDMSKRIMNEVMCLAEDIGCEIYYQDTDSMHILESDVPRLAEEFKKVYGRELIGDDMGQFHGDFDCKGLDKDTTIAIESYFIGKKVYVDKLADKDNKIGYHVRMKGISREAIDEVANGDVMALYHQLYEKKDKTIEFNLLAGYRPSFEFTLFNVKSRKTMTRKIRRLIARADGNDFKNNENDED